MPLPSSFESPEAYYSTFAHELVHSTGHESRLSRDLTGNFGSGSYAAEELIAEIGACLILAECDVEPRFEESAAYIASWKKVMEDNPKIIVTAASKAGKAADFIVGRDRSAVHAASPELVAA
jgi:antirestriction protein ArdC